MHTLALSPSDASDLTVAGRRVGVAIGHYLRWLAENAARDGHRRLFFLSREGAWLAGHYSRLRAATANAAAWPEPVCLAVSRRSTFLASMPALSPQALAPFLAQYGNATVATVLDSLGLGAEEVGSGVSPESLWRQPGVAERLLGDPATAERLDARRQEQRALLLHYLDQNGVLAQSRIAAADVGWRGTIEDNLARLLPEHRLDGYYLALFPAFSPAPSNAGKTGFVLDAQSPYALTRRLRFVAPLEFICSDRALSAVAYARNLCEVTPVYDMLQVVPADSPAFRCLQDGVSEGVVSMGTLGRPDAGEASMLLLDLIERPPAALAALYFQAWRDDRYGAGTLHRDAPRIDLRQVLAALVSRKARRSLGLAMADSGWPWALLVRDLNPLAPLVRRLVLALDARL